MKITDGKKTKYDEDGVLVPDEDMVVFVDELN